MFLIKDKHNLNLNFSFTTIFPKLSRNLLKSPDSHILEDVLV